MDLRMRQREPMALMLMPAALSVLALLTLLALPDQG
jgi:hypothetical protein